MRKDHNHKQLIKMVRGDGGAANLTNDKNKLR